MDGEARIFRSSWFAEAFVNVNFIVKQVAQSGLTGNIFVVEQPDHHRRQYFVDVHLPRPLPLLPADVGY